MTDDDLRGLWYKLKEIVYLKYHYNPIFYQLFFSRPFSYVLQFKIRCYIENQAQSVSSEYGMVDANYSCQLQLISGN